MGFNAGQFWNDYGDAHAELAALINSKEMLFEAIECYKKAVLQEGDAFEGWFSLALCYGKVFELNGEEKYFQCAHECHAKAANLCSTDVHLWLKWGSLLVAYAKLKGDIEKLSSSFEKFVRANACETNNPLVLFRWGEAEMLYGAEEERMDLLKSAEEKIIKSLEISPENSDAWYGYGTCLNELGSYFNDDQFHWKAIEKFHYGLSISQNNPILWCGLAHAHFAIGELRNAYLLSKKPFVISPAAMKWEASSILKF